MVPFVAAGAGLITMGIVNVLVKVAFGGWEGTWLLMDGSSEYANEP